jgi:hypothetical protein
VAVTIDVQRRRLFQAHAVVSVSAVAVVDEIISTDTVATALECAADIIDNVARALEDFAGDEAGGAP